MSRYAPSEERPQALNGIARGLCVCAVAVALFAAALWCDGCSTPSPTPVAVPTLAAHCPAPPAAIPPDPLTTSEATNIPETLAAGRIGAKPFIARSVTLWQDATHAWLSFEPEVPTTGGRYDPRARRRPDSAFVVFLDLTRLRKGTWTASAPLLAGTAGVVPASPRVVPASPRVGAPSPEERDEPSPAPSTTRAPAAGRLTESPITGATLQIVDHVSRNITLIDSGWQLVLHVDGIVTREERPRPLGQIYEDPSVVTETDIRGRIALRFASGPSWICGSFVAHDLLRPDEVAPGQPVVPVPPASPYLPMQN